MPDTDEHGPGCSCRDSRLNCAGDSFDYTKGGIRQRIEREHAPIHEQASHEAPKPPVSFDPSEQRQTSTLRAPHIYISRYTIEDRKRTMLELILIEALKIVALFMDMFQLRNPPNDHPIYQSWGNYKIFINPSVYLYCNISNIKNKVRKFMLLNLHTLFAFISCILLIIKTLPRSCP